MPKDLIKSEVMGRLKKKQKNDFFPPELFNNSEIKETKKKGTSNQMIFHLYILFMQGCLKIYLLIEMLVIKYKIHLKITIKVLKCLLLHH